MALYLKVLSGPHVGAEIALEPGTYVIGSDDSCDFILSDAGLSAKHCRLRVEDDSISLVVLEGIVWNGNRRFERDETVPISFGSLYRLGTVFVSFFREGDPWQDPVIPSLWVEEPLTPSEPHEDSGEEAEMKKAGETEIFQPASKSPVKLTFSRVVLLVLVTLFAMGSVFLWFFSKHGDSKKTKLLKDESSIESPKEHLTRLLDARGHPSLRVEVGGGGMVGVSGIVASAGDRSQLRMMLASVGFPVRLNIWTEGEIQDLIKGLLGEVSVWDLDVSAEESGVVKISGYVSTIRDLEKFQKVVQNSLPMDFLSFEWSIRTLEQAEHDLRKLLSSDLGGLQVRRLDRAMSIQGQVDPSQEPAYREVLRRFVERYGEGVLKDEVHVMTIVPEPPSIQVEAVVMGPKRFFLTSSGRKVFQGEELGEGYWVQSIERDKILLRHGERETHVAIQPKIVLRYAW